MITAEVWLRPGGTVFDACHTSSAERFKVPVGQKLRVDAALAAEIDLCLEKERVQQRREDVDDLGADAQL